MSVLEPTAAPSGAADGPPTASVSLDGVTAGYDDRPAISDVSVDFRAGRLTAVFGPNGGGKSTLLKVVAGLLRPWSGTCRGPRRGAGRARPAGRLRPPGGDRRLGVPGQCRDVAMMGRYPALGPFRRPSRLDHDAVAAALEHGRHDRSRPDPDRVPVGWPAATGVPGSSARGGARAVPARRAGHRRRCDDPGGPDAICSRPRPVAGGRSSPRPTTSPARRRGSRMSWP